MSAAKGLEVVPTHRVKAPPGWPGIATSALANAYKEEAWRKRQPQQRLGEDRVKEKSCILLAVLHVHVS